jgi:hypothetical protein
MSGKHPKDIYDMNNLAMMLNIPVEHNPSNASQSNGFRVSARVKLAAAFSERFAFSASEPARHCKMASSGKMLDSLHNGIAKKWKKQLSKSYLGGVQ